MLEVPHSDVVKEKLGPLKLEVLEVLFKTAQGAPPAVIADRFRADHSNEWRDALDSLEQSNALIERTLDSQSYLIRPYALPLIPNQRASKILDLMDRIFQRLKELYRRDLSKQQSIENIVKDISGSKAQKTLALYYLGECHAVWSGKSIDFPYSESPHIVISEAVLRYDSIADILAQHYGWHYVNPAKETTDVVDWPSGTQSAPSGFWGEPSKSGFPDWYDALDEIKKALVKEIDLALKLGISALPTIGLRTLLATVFTELVGDVGSFQKKLKCLEERGYITAKHSSVLSMVLDVGNASAHRAYFPDRDDILACAEVVKHLMQGIYVLEPRVNDIAKRTPKRKQD